MKKGFTLVEMLIVIVVIAVLMGMVMRFGNISSDERKRATTVSRLQRLENALSGYYAAFGTYPPVRLHGSRNIYLRVSSHCIQNTDGDENTALWGWLDSNGKVSNTEAEWNAWEQVKAACKAQPVACYYPYPDQEVFKQFVNAYSEAMKSYVGGQEDIKEDVKRKFQGGFDTGVPLGRFGSYRNKMEWTEVQLFKFGLLSFLLPRYLFMMDGPRELFRDYAQWTGNNQLPRDPLNGRQYSGGWERMRDEVRNNDLARVANIPSQAVCARWISNFEKSLSVSRPLKLFGIDLMGESAKSAIGEGTAGSRIRPNLDLEIYSPGGYSQDNTSGQYILDSTTILDGWENEFYYYSPPPYQSYVVWSAGPNGRTFPPWVARDSLASDANRCVGYWIADDIVSLKK